MWVVAVAAWLALSAVAALVLGRAIRMADRRGPSPLTANGNFALDVVPR